MTTLADEASTSRASRAASGSSGTALLLLTVAASAGAVGWVWASHHNGVTVKHGTAYSTPEQISVTAGGVAYNVPLQLPWLSADHVWHEDRPACLPPNFKQVPMTFGAVEWKHGDLVSVAM